MGCSAIDSAVLSIDRNELLFSGHVYRNLFAFDPERKAVVLCGGDKKGKNQEKFYQKLVVQAESVFDKHLKRLQQNKRRNNENIRKNNPK